MRATVKRTAPIPIALLAALATAAPSAHAAPAPGWRIAHLTRPGTDNGDELRDVTAFGPRNAWAVGEAGWRPDSNRLLVQRWDGRSWRRMHVPNALLTGGAPAGLDHVVMRSPKDVWAFGATQHNDPAKLVAYGLHWNGIKWSKKAFHRGTRISAAAVVPGGVWVVGYNARTPNKSLVQRFDGRSWHAMPAPGRRFFVGGLSALSNRDIWAVGTRYPNPSLPLAYPGLAHWDGRTWKEVPGPRLRVPEGIEYQFTDVLARGHDVWATAKFRGRGSGEPYAKASLLHWNGRRWREVSLPPGLHLTGIDRDGLGGFWLSASPNRMAHLRAGRTTVVRLPQGAGREPMVNSLTYIPGTRSLWAVGTITRRRDTTRLGATWTYGG